MEGYSEILMLILFFYLLSGFSSYLSVVIFTDLTPFKLKTAILFALGGPSAVGSCALAILEDKTGFMTKFCDWMDS